MDNFAITHIFFSDAPTYTRLILFTNNPCHLFGYKTSVEPVLKTHWDLIRGMPLRCIPEWRIMRARVHEQNEPGDTTLHTIDTPGWMPGQTYWLVTLGTVAGVDSPSIGPILRHINPGGAIFPVTRFPSSPGDLTGAFVVTPPGLPHWQAINQDPPDENTTFLRGTQTLGPFPAHGGGELYHIDSIPSPQKYFLVERVLVYFRIKAANWGWPWTCTTRWPSYASQLKLSTGQLYMWPPQFTSGWDVWRTSLDHSELSPFTGDYWYYKELENIQVGLHLRQPCQHSWQAQTYCTQLYFVIRFWGEALAVYP